MTKEKSKESGDPPPPLSPSQSSTVLGIEEGRTRHRLLPLFPPIRVDVGEQRQDDAISVAASDVLGGSDENGGHGG
jgi:hypothetical protein